MLFCCLQFRFHLLQVADGILHFVEELPGVFHFRLQCGQRSFAVVPPFLLPGLKLFASLAVGSLFFAGGYDGLDALLQLWAPAHRNSALLNKGTAAKHLAVYACQQLAAVKTGHALNRNAGVGIRGGKLLHRGIPRNGGAREGQITVIGSDIHTPFHRGTGPRRISDGIREGTALGLDGGIKPIEHGANKGAPGAFSAFVGGVDDIQPTVKTQALTMKLPEGGLNITDSHARSPPRRFPLPRDPSERPVQSVISQPR